MTRPTRLTIDLSALRHNLVRVRHFAPRSAVVAMVKANAYGHGMVRVAQAMPDVDAFGVASLEEGVILREAGITQPIILMEGLFQASEIADAAHYQFTLVVHHEPQVAILENAKVSHPFPIWLKINTGMHRLGIAPSQFSAIYERLSKISAVQQPIGLMTHFAEADVVDSAGTQQQIDVFTQLTKGLPGPRSLANSAGIIAWPQTHTDLVRPGLMLYGASPFADKTGLDHQLKPVMTLSSQLIAITSVQQGGKVGYGGTWAAPEDLTVGVVGVGYGDGYPQFAKNGTPILVNGVECELAGRVSMDMLTVDLRRCPDAKIGDRVTLWGDSLPVERVAKCSHTSAYELLTRMTARPKLEIKA